MSRSRRKCYRSARFRVPRFEQLEDRHLLSVANQAITTDAGAQQMPSVAFDPLDSKHVVEAYMDYSLGAAVLGDYNGNGIVDAADYTVWRDTLGSTTNLAADGNNNHVIDSDDYTVWNAHVGQSGYAGIGVAISHDGGGTWQHTSVPLPANFEQGAANPTVMLDNVDHDPNQAGVQNDVYVSFMAATFLDGQPPITNPDGGDARIAGFESNNGIFVSHSSDGGLNWQAPVAVVSHLYDGTHKVPFEIIPSLAIDTFAKLPDGKTANPRYGNLYVTWTRYYAAGQFPDEPDASGGSDVMIATSSNGGQTWQIRTQPAPSTGTPITVLQDDFNDGRVLPALGFNGWARPTVGPDGDVYVAYFSGGWYPVDHSSDGGATFFVAPQDDTNIGMPFGNGVIGVSSSFAVSNSQFRTQPSRVIAADPSHPGVVYAAEAVKVSGDSELLDHADIKLSYSTDYGQTWLKTPITINDDNGGNPASGLPDDVTAEQVMVQLAVGADGKVGLVWLDTRTDPANKLLNVFGAVGTPGTDQDGKFEITFSPNFRITDQSFNADEGKFIDANGNQNFYFGDAIGLAMAGDAMAVTWTDTRQGNQDIFFRSVPLTPSLPLPLNDRFEPNDGPDTATTIGPDPAFKTFLPRLTLAAGEDDWFKITPPTSELTISAKSTGDASNLQLELTDSTGTIVIVDGTSLTSDDGTTVVGAQIFKAPVDPSQTYLVHVHSTAEVGSTGNDIGYSLDVSTVTADLGAVAHQVVDGSLQSGDKAYYLLDSKVAGSIDVAFNIAAGTTTVDLFDLANPTTPIASNSGASPHIRVPVGVGQKLLVRVTGGVDADGAFSLTLTNLDQYSDPGLDLLHFPAGANPSQEAIADFNGDGISDIAMANAGSNTVSILLGNGIMQLQKDGTTKLQGDGTFTAPRQFAVGAFRLPNPVGEDTLLNTYRRAIVAADFDKDGITDLAVTNYDSSDVSLLLGIGDGTFKPQRRFNATAAPYGMVAGDVNGDGYQDLVVIEVLPNEAPNHLAVLLGGSNGTFAAQKLMVLPNHSADGTLALADLDGDKNLDLIVAGGDKTGLDVFQGDGHGSFSSMSSTQAVPFGHFPATRQASQLLVTDVNGDKKLDILATALTSENGIFFLPGNGDGSFGTVKIFPSGQFPIAFGLTDWGTELADGTFEPGVPDGHPDLIVANSGTVIGVVPITGPPNVVVLPGIYDSNGVFQKFGDPIPIASAEQPLDLEVRDFDQDGSPDVGVVDRNEFFVIYGHPPQISANDTPATARELGTVMHQVEPTLTITPGHEDAWYRLQVPTEVLSGTGDEVLDFSGGFANQEGGGLMMEVGTLDQNKVFHQLDAGERFRIAAHQGETLYVHVFGQEDVQTKVDGTGAYTLVIDTLPQIVDAEAPNLLPGQGNKPGGPTTSLVLVLQGDRLNAATAEDPNNYVVTWLGPDGVKGGGDDRQILVGTGLPAGSQAVIYDPGSNVEFSSSTVYPKAVRQTLTLLFGEPLPAGSYKIEILPTLVSADFNSDELGLLSPLDPPDPPLDKDHPEINPPRHPVVSVADGAIQAGAILTKSNLVQPSTPLGDFAAFNAGTSFLTQLQNDLGALLDGKLTDAPETEVITDQLVKELIAVLGPALGALGQRPASLGVFLGDPVSFGLVAPDGVTFTYDLQHPDKVANNLPGAFVEVSGNIELLVIANPVGNYQLNVSDVPARARSAVVFLGNQAPEVHSLTEALRKGGDQSFSINFPLDTNVLAAVAVAASQAGTARLPSALVLPDFTALGAFSSSASLLTALAIDAVSLSPASTTGGDGLDPRSLLAPAQSVLDELFSTWDELDHSVLRRLQKEEGVSTDALPDLFPTLRVWQIMENLLDEILSPHAGTTPAQTPPAKGRHVAQRDADPTASKQGDAEPTQDSARSDASAPSSDSLDSIQAAASQADEDQSATSVQRLGGQATHTTNSSIPSQEPSADAHSTGGDQSHATAA